MINWNNIRPLNGSQQEGFEELICQLAQREPVVVAMEFVRVGKPDGGKECYWQTEGGGIYAWQAKYFTNSFSETQWKQIDQSVTDTIDNHPMLVRYTICCPLDRPDGKVRGKTSLLTKWQQKVNIWKAYALEKGMTVEIEYWGNSELIALLSKRTNDGMRYFWFNQEEFTDEWFAYKNDESIVALGGRHSATLNFELPIVDCFDGLARDDQFVKTLNKRFDKLFDSYRSFRFPKDEAFTNHQKTMEELLVKFKVAYLQTKFTGTNPVNYRLLGDMLYECQKIADDVDNELHRIQRGMEKIKPTSEYSARPFSMEMSALQKLSDEIYLLKEFFYGKECELSNLPVLIVIGEAGAGKSHLLADIVKRRAAKDQLSLFLLGENFTDRSSPWSQILQHQLLKTTIDELVFLGALNAKAEAKGSRLLLFIDALNEGEGRFVWPNRLEIFIKLIRQYPNLGLVISIRDSFVELIAPHGIIHEKVAVRIEHTGFADTSYEASALFFKHYGIVQPGSPMLNPEFQNPLFLKLFCRSLQEKGMHTVPTGYFGITVIIDFYLEGINYKLAQANEWDFDERLKLVRRSVQSTLQQMVADDTDYLSYLAADEIIEGVFKGKCTHPQPFLKRLVSEGVFNVDLYWDNEGNSYDVIYFAYQRFQDHLIVSTLLDLFLDKEKPNLSFQSGKLFELVKDEKSVRLNQNLIEALAIQLPEKIGLELFEVAPSCKRFYAVAHSFVKSLMWRKENTINQAAKDFVNEMILPDRDLFDFFLDTTISTTMKLDYYFNAYSLHKYLARFKMQERDAVWTTWLQDKYGRDAQHNSVQRLIDWSFEVTDISHISDEAIGLGVNTMAWFLCSCNRYLRDSTTKSMVNLLQHRLHLLIPLLDKFKDVDDLYVIERLYAVAYGCVLRSNSTKNIGKIADYTFRQVFDQKMVIPHDLLRDYARGIVDLAIDKGFVGNIDVKRVRPPYKSKKLPKRLTSLKTIDKKYDPKGETGYFGREKWGATAILSSMTTEYGRGTAGYGDFGRYVFGYAFSDFDIDVDRLSNYAVDLIFKMGYDPIIFSDFDGKQGSGRGSGHKERIGKKYQWIVLHELLARVSDNCILFEKGYRPKKRIVQYEGTWMTRSRDIDPSILIKKLARDSYSDNAISPWLTEFSFQWTLDDHSWIRDNTGQPKPSEVILFKDTEGVEWLWLEVHPVWTQPDLLGEDKFVGSYKEVWYQIRSYFVKKDKVATIRKAVKDGFEPSQFDDAKSLSNVFNREYYTAPAYLYFTDIDDANGDWISINHNRTGKPIGSVLGTTEEYFWEKEYDCSKEDSIIFFKPASVLVNGLSLRYSLKEGSMINAEGDIVCFDPSVNCKSTRGLLIRKSAMDQFLQNEQLILIWTVVGEKQVNARNWKERQYPGQMNMSGIYTYEQGNITGNLVFQMD